MGEGSAGFRSEGQIAAGLLALVVGPSGAGKDTLIDGARSALAHDRRITFARRVVTRASNDPSEAHDVTTAAGFDAARAAGAFLLDWEAHGLGYGIPVSAAAALGEGRLVVANVSRSVIGVAERRVARVVVLHITAPAEVLARRLAARGREPAEAIAARIARKAPLTAARADVVEIVNDGTVAAGVARLTGELTRLAAVAAAPAR